MSEKDRERELRTVGFEVVRYNLDMAMRRPAELLRRVDVAARLRSGRPVPDCGSMDPPTDIAHPYAM